MAILHSGSGLVTARTTITGLQGILELVFTDWSSGSAGDTVSVNIKSDKLGTGEVHLPPADTSTPAGQTHRYNGFRLSTSSKAFTLTSPRTLGAIRTAFYQTAGSATTTITNGIGKIDLESSDTQQNIKNVSELAGLVITQANVDIFDGTVIFSRAVTATASTVTTAGTSIGSAAVNIKGGSGTASLTSLLNVTLSSAAAASQANIAFTAVAGVTADSLIGRQFEAGGVLYTISDNTTTQITVSENLSAAIASGTILDIIDPDFKPAVIRLDELDYGNVSNTTSEPDGYNIVVADAIRLTPVGSSVIWR